MPIKFRFRGGRGIFGGGVKVPILFLWAWIFFEILRVKHAVDFWWKSFSVNFLARKKSFNIYHQIFTTFFTLKFARSKRNLSPSAHSGSNLAQGKSLKRLGTFNIQSIDGLEKSKHFALSPSPILSSNEWQRGTLQEGHLCTKALEVVIYENS